MTTSSLACLAVRVHGESAEAALVGLAAATSRVRHHDDLVSVAIIAASLVSRGMFASWSVVCYLATLIFAVIDTARQCQYVDDSVTNGAHGWPSGASCASYELYLYRKKKLRLSLVRML